MANRMYEFDAGSLCLDYANTLNWHASAHPEEMITGFLDLVSWGQQAGLLTPDQVLDLQQLNQQDPYQASELYAAALQVREAIYRVFSRRYAGEPVADADLALLNATIREALSHRVMVPSADGFTWQWVIDGETTNRILWPVAMSAAELLTSSDALRVRECEDDRGCGFLFIDQTKNHSRRWCSMISCGNRAKARRHYSRTQAAG